MDDMENIFVETLDRLLHKQCTTEVIRKIEGGGSASSLWRSLEESGFADALLTEERGGTGLDLTQIFPLIELCGRHALPVPLAQTMVARAIISEANETPPSGSIAIGSAERDNNGNIIARAISYGQVADWALLELDDATVLLPIGAREPHIFPVDATLTWTAKAVPHGMFISSPAGNLLVLHACLFAVQLGGAMMKIFEQTLQHANDRQQFGRAIGKFQAIQHQLSVMAELVFASRMAAQIGCRSTPTNPNPLAVAAAKARTSEAAVEVATIAHAVHGAIGFTAEFDLQLFTRRLHAWRQAAGSESYWQDQLGSALVDNHKGKSLDFLRHLTDIR